MEIRSTIGDIGSPAPAVGPDTICEETANVFAKDPAVYVIAVVDEDHRPIGLLNRFKFLERLSGRFGRALTVTRSVGQFMERNPLVLDESTPIDRGGELFVAADNAHVLDGFIITRDGRYAAVGTGLDLMRALTERRHSELMRQARHDSLTGLPNRYQFDLHLLEAIADRRRGANRLALLFIDLDWFKHVNDTFGHRAGDFVLRTMAARLRANLRRHDIVARLSGDEFAVVLTDVDDTGSAEMVAMALLRTCAAPIDFDGQSITVSCSIGVAVYPDDGMSSEQLIQASDAAVYCAKQVRNTSQRYRPDMAPGVERPTLDLVELRQAIDREELTVHYQPKIDLRTDRVCGVEALVRWPHAVRGMVPAAELVRLAEDAGLIVPISEFVIRTAMCDVLRLGRALGREDLRLAVNISSVQLRHDGLLGMLDRLVAELGFPCQNLELEITESAAMLAGRSTAATLRALKLRGHVLAIDDFGTGYSSLSQLERMPVDVLKIDKSFIADLGRPGGHGTIAKAIIGLGRSLGLTVVAEGVETDAQLAFLREQHCDVAQGFLFGRPQPVDELLAQRAWRGPCALTPTG